MIFSGSILFGPEIYFTEDLLHNNFQNMFYTLWFFYGSSNGEEWWKLRSVFQRCLSRVQDVRSHLPVTDTIMMEFTKYAAKNSIPTTDFLPKLSRLYLECK